MGDDRPFEMADGYLPAEGIRRFVSGTPPVLGMLALREMLEVIAEAGIDAVRAKSVALTAYAVARYDAVLAPYGVLLSTPRDPAARGGHITIDHPSFSGLTARLWERGIIPDFRRPAGIRVGLSPLSTSFAEIDVLVDAVREHLDAERS
jgi:kynureninase